MAKARKDAHPEPRLRGIHLSGMEIKGEGAPMSQVDLSESGPSEPIGKNAEVASAGDRHLHPEKAGRRHRELDQRASRGRRDTARLRGCTRLAVAIVADREDGTLVAAARIDPRVQRPERLG